MKIGTKALVSLFIITMLTLSVSGSALALGSSERSSRPNDSDRLLERLQQHHDRKMELRASVIGISAEQLRSELKSKTFQKILKEHGFASKEAFHTALSGKIKDELMRRGWDEKKIQNFLQKRFERLHR